MRPSWRHTTSRRSHGGRHRRRRGLDVGRNPAGLHVDAGHPLDVPKVVASPTPLTEAGVYDRCRVYRGDMLEESAHLEPTRTSSKRVLMIWGDEQATQVLRNCAAVLPRSGKVLVIEMIMPPSNESEPCCGLRCTDPPCSQGRPNQNRSRAPWFDNRRRPETDEGSSRRRRRTVSSRVRSRRPDDECFSRFHSVRGSVWSNFRITRGRRPAGDPERWQNGRHPGGRALQSWRIRISTRP